LMVMNYDYDGHYFCFTMHCPISTQKRVVLDTYNQLKTILNLYDMNQSLNLT